MSSFKLKVLLTGAAAVGKTSLVQRFIKNRFAANYKLTVGVGEEGFTRLAQISSRKM